MVKDFLLAALPWVCMGLALALFFGTAAAKRKRRDARRAEEKLPAADGQEKPAAEEAGNYMSEGMSLGMCIGLAIGTSIDQLALGMSLGMLLGLCVGMSIKKEK